MYLKQLYKKIKYSTHLIDDVYIICEQMRPECECNVLKCPVFSEWVRHQVKTMTCLCCRLDIMTPLCYSVTRELFCFA